jgi:hypothetical protein
MVDTQASREAVATPGLPRVELRFLAQGGSRQTLAFALGLLCALLLGAGTYGTFLAPERVGFSLYLLLGAGALGALGAYLFAQTAAVRVGDLGVALERAEEVSRLPWYEVKSVSLAGAELVVAGEGNTLRFPNGEHAPAVREIVAQAARRIPARVQLSSNAHDRLPKGGAAGAWVPILGFQVTGRRCMASGTPITFEADARLCPNCAALYHVRSVPEICKACSTELRPPLELK